MPGILKAAGDHRPDAAMNQRANQLFVCAEVGQVVTDAVVHGAWRLTEAACRRQVRLKEGWAQPQHGTTLTLGQRSG